MSPPPTLPAALLVAPYGLGDVDSPYVRISPAANREELLKSLADVPRAFVYLTSPTCPISEYARPAFATVAASYGSAAEFVASHPVAYSPKDGDSSPTLLYVEHGKVVQYLLGLSFTNGGGSRQLRTKFLYEGFVVSNLYGIDVSADLRMPVSEKFLFMRPHLWLYSFTPKEPADLSGRDLRTLISQNSALRGYDFSNADLRGAKFWHSDLRGAKFEGAKLEGAEWSGSICPDGHRVESTADSCVGHLDARPAAP